MNIELVLLSFNRRITRREYWLKGILPALGIGIAIGIAFTLIGVAIELAAGPGTIGKQVLELVINIISMLFWILMIIIHLAIFTKRWHDLGRSGMWSLLIFIPIIGFAMLIYLGVAHGEAEENQYGLVPG